MKLVSDCFGIMVTESNYVMFSKGAGTKAEFRQGLVEKIGKKYVYIAEVDGKGELLRDENEELIIHKRSARGILRVFTEQEHKETLNEQEETNSEIHETTA